MQSEHNKTRKNTILSEQNEKQKIPHYLNKMKNKNTTSSQQNEQQKETCMYCRNEMKNKKILHCRNKMKNKKITTLSEQNEKQKIPYSLTKMKNKIIHVGTK